MAAPFAPIIGSTGKIYRNTATINDPTFGLIPHPNNPTWDLMPNVRDVEVPIDFTDVDVTSRLGGGFKQHEPALGDLSLSLVMLYNPYDDDMAFLIKAAWLRLAVELLILDQDRQVNLSQGIRATFKVFKSSRPEKVDGMMEQMFDLKPCWTQYAPSYVYTANPLPAPVSTNS